MSLNSNTASPEGQPSLYAWAVVAMLFPVALLNYLDRMMVATMRGSIRADIPSITNDTDFGFLIALFMWVYALLSPIGGLLADRFSKRWVVISSLFVWSLMTWLTGYAHTFTEMAWARALMGISEAFYIPAALAMIAEFHPGVTRSRAIGIHMCGIYAGQALGGLGGYIADTSSWRNAFHWFGAAGLAYAVLLLFVLKDNEARIVKEAQSNGAGVVAAAKALFGSWQFLILVVYFTLPSVSGWVIKNWLPTYLASQFNLKQGPAGLSATGYVTIAMFFGALLGGVLADRARRVTLRGSLYITALGMAMCSPALLGLGYASTMQTAIGFMLLFGLGFGFFDANNMPILCQIVRPEYRATGYGILNMASIGAGAIVTVIMGSMRDHGVSLSVTFTLSAIITAFAGLLILAIRPRTA